ncbi:protein of unknown function [Candidatus Hydrogenisulfobacillus filiaventi]|uniref:Peptidase S9 prolyl oligopeptidase catalytic domain-containing protein n=1 Tax=Candidatus Hydrogenisulfobacillus filiaventi TaxID=2707344 RepID=A0A6F8ZEJ1_9FIRM|nr:protein of unknown function [Candidatus Hydrogenisulfobacillus filiaventi]
MRTVTVEGVPFRATEGLEDTTRPVVVVVPELGPRDAGPELWTPARPDRWVVAYWDLPLLRERREELLPKLVYEPLYSVYIPVWEAARREMAAVLEAWGERPVGLIGFGDGGMLAMWIAADNRARNVRAVVSVSGSPTLEFLKDRYPDAGWPAEEAKKTLGDWDITYRVPRIGSAAVLLLHGAQDHTLREDWDEEFYLMATTVTKYPERWDYRRLEGLPHDWRDAADPAQQAAVAEARAQVEAWLETYLTP